MESRAIEKGELDKHLFAYGVPKWLHLKAVNKDFTANLKQNVKLLLFPRGKYTNAISLTTKELRDKEFVNNNKLVLSASKSIFMLASHSYSGLQSVPKAHSAELEDNFQNHP